MLQTNTTLRQTPPPSKLNLKHPFLQTQDLMSISLEPVYKYVVRMLCYKIRIGKNEKKKKNWKKKKKKENIFSKLSSDSLFNFCNPLRLEPTISNV